MTAHPPIRLNDLDAQRRRIGDAVDAAVKRVMDHGQFIMGPEVAALETALEAFCDARHVVSCSNGTDALVLALRAKSVGPGDAVIVPSFTFAASAEAVALVSASPVFADIDPGTFNLDPDSVEDAIRTARAAGLRPVAIIAVDLFGQPADYRTLTQIAEDQGLWLLADAAQSLGARYHNRPVGSLAPLTTASFFPAKPLGCYGDGGAVLTDDEETATLLRSLRVHGKGDHKYDNVRIGQNARLDTLQAAVLLEKLKIFPEEIEARNRVADRYRLGLSDLVETPSVVEGCQSVWAQYTIRVPDGRRDSLAAHLAAREISTAIYYPKPLHRQKAYENYPMASGGLPASEKAAGEVLSLPMHPYLDAESQDRVVEALRDALATS